MWNKIQRIYVGDHYQVYPKTVPQVWLLGYRPLQSDLKDASWHWKDWSWYSGTGTFWTAGNYTWANITHNNVKSTNHIVTTLNYSWPTVTMCWWVYYTSLTSTSNLRQAIMTNTSTTAENNYISLSPRPAQSNRWTVGVAGNILTSTTSATTWNWVFVCWVISSSWKSIYLNWNLISNDSSWVTTWQWGMWRLWCWQVWAQLDWDFGGFTWLIRHCAVYNRGLTADEVSQYYNLTA